MEKSPSPICTKDLSLKRKTSIEVPIVNIKAEDEAKADASEVLNGKPNKEIITKLSELMTNMDPLEHFSRFLGIPDMIFRHFKGKDLIRISEVSPCYYDFIATSKLLMENIQVVLGKKRTLENTEDSPIYPNVSLKELIKFRVGFQDKCDSEDYHLLKNSSRLYQNIKIKRSLVCIKHRNGFLSRVGDYVTNSELDVFYSKAHEWKKISLDNVYFRKSLDFWRLLSAIESSVESFSVEDFGCLSLEDPSSENESFKALKFPKLKKLKMTFKNDSSVSDTWARFFLNSVAIEELFLSLFGQVDKDILTKMLQNFDKLTSLYIESCNVYPSLYQIFEDESWKQFQFKLKSLTVFIFEFSSIGPNFRNFLKSQSDYLEKLSFPAADLDRETFGMIMKMPKLKNLTLMHSEIFPENGAPIKMSNSITELNLRNWPNAGSLKFLLDSMPKARHLRLHAIDEECFKMLKSMNRKFETLKVLNLRGVDRKEMEEIMNEINN